MIIDLIHSHEYRNIQDLVNTLQQLDRSIRFGDIKDAINELKDDNKITLSEPRAESSFLSFITDLSRSAPLWLTILITTLTLTTVYLTPQAVPWSFVRICAGAALVLFIPGYVLTHLLFPVRHMDMIERIALSVGLSLAVTPSIGLLLNYSPWGITLGPIVISISLICIVMIFGGTYRKFVSQSPA